MAVTLMSNPGLHLALLGNPRRKLPKHGFKTRKAFTQAVARAAKRVGRRFKIKGGKTYTIKSARVKSRTSRSKSHLAGISWSGRKGGTFYRGRVGRKPIHRFTNPGASMSLIKGYVSAVKAAPKQILGLFKGPSKIKHAAYAAGGAAGSYVLSGVVSSKLLQPALAMLPPSIGRFVAPGTMGSRIVGGLMPFTVGYAASKFIKGDIGKALLVGGAVASLVELAMPGQIGLLLNRGAIAAAPVAPAAVVALKGLGALDGPVAGLDGYVDAPSYQGVGVDGYVDAPSYQGVGDDGDTLAGPEDVLADDGDELDGYLQESAKYAQTYLN